MWLGIGAAWVLAACGRAHDPEQEPPGSQGGNGGMGSGGNGGSTEQKLPGSLALKQEQVLDIRLSLSAADWRELEEHGNKEEYVPASVTLRGDGFSEVSLGRVGLRHKGNYSLHHCWDENGGVRDYTDECRKLSWKIKFDEYDAAERFDGLKRLNLHAGSGDQSKVREFLAYDTFAEFGVDAPRAVPARVFINGQPQGLYIAVEEVDGRYTKAHYPSGADGNLYKEIWPQAATPDQKFQEALETNEAAADVADMRGFSAAVDGATEADFAARVEPWLKLEDVLRYMVVDRATKNWDGITAFYDPATSHNFYWYHDDSAEPRFHLIPWDLDNTFWEFDPYTQPEQWVTARPVPNWNAAPIDCARRSVWMENGAVTVSPMRCDHLLDLLARTSWSRFVTLGQQFLNGPFSDATLRRKIDAFRSRIAPIVVQDPMFDVAAWSSGVDALKANIPRLRGDFTALLAEGLIEEAPPPTIGPPPSDLDSPTPNSGLQTEGVTNFEYATPISVEPANLFHYGDTLATHAASWNTAAPLSGKADLRFDFTFTRQPGTYDEYVGLGIVGARGEVDLRDRTAIIFTVVADRARTIRVRVESAIYMDTWGGIWSEFGREVAVGPTPRTIEVPLSSLVYPEWAKAAWTSGQGFTIPDTEARALVLRRFGGLVFTVSPTLDASGELISDVESGYVQLDNIWLP